MTRGAACLAALAATALLAIAPTTGPTAPAVAKPNAERARPSERTGSAARRGGVRTQQTLRHPRAAAMRKRVRANARRMRWRAASAALRIGPGALFGGPGPEGSTSPAPGAGPGGSQPGGGGPTPGPAPVYHTLSVASREFSLTLSRQLLTPGTQTIQLNNRGEDPHNLVIGPDDGSGDAVATYPDVESLESHTEHVELPAGRYKLWCSLPGHEALGMRQTLRVE